MSESTMEIDLLEFEELFEGAVQKMNTTSSSEANAAVEVLAKDDSKLLFNFGAPFHVNKRERPIHRLMVELSAKGYKNKEIAEMTRRTTVNVNNAVRQPHSQQHLVDEINRKVNEDQRVVEYIRSKVVVAVETLAEVMENDKVSPGSRIAAAEALLNRRYGKPNQPINRGSEIDLNSLSDEDLVKMAMETQTTTSK